MRYYWLICCFFGSITWAQAQPTVDSLHRLDWQDYLYRPVLFRAFVNDPNYYTSEVLLHLGKYRRFLPLILNDATYLKAFYQRSLPAIQRVWGQLDLVEKARLRHALLHLKVYLEDLDLASETRYLKACDTLPGHYMATRSHLQFHRNISDYFVRYDPVDDFYNGDWNNPKPEAATSPYRRLESFCYRRLKAGTPKANVLYLIDQLLLDLDFPINKRIKTSDQKLLIQDGYLHGDFFYQTPQLKESGRYDRGVKVGKWEQSNHSERIQTTYDAQGLMIERNWQSLYGSRLIYEIWFSIPQQKVRFVDYHRDGSSTIDYEGQFN